MFISSCTQLSLWYCHSQYRCCAVAVLRSSLIEAATSSPRRAASRFGVSFENGGRAICRLTSSSGRGLPPLPICSICCRSLDSPTSRRTRHTSLTCCHVLLGCAIFSSRNVPMPLHHLNRNSPTAFVFFLLRSVLGATSIPYICLNRLSGNFQMKMRIPECHLKTEILPQQFR